MTLALLMVACEGDVVGDGGGPTAVRIVYGTQADAVQTVECATLPLTAIASFSGGQTGDTNVSSRVTWRSSNPGVIDVSNGEIETAPGSGATFPAGTVIARTTGDAVIRADYAGLQALFAVSAATLESLRIAPPLTRMTPDSSTTFRLYARAAKDQLEQDLSDSAVWQLPGNSQAAEISSGSTVRAHANPLATPFTLEARLYSCDRSRSLALQLAVPTALRLSYEQPESVAVPLLLGDRLRVDAVFADASAPPQNLSAQVDVETADGYAPDIATTSVASSTVSRSRDVATCTALALATPCAYLEPNDYLMVDGLQRNKPVRLMLSFDPTGLALGVVTREYRFADLDLSAVSLSAPAASLRHPDLGWLEASGTFNDGEARPVSRYVGWLSEDTDLLTVTPSGLDGGLLTPANLNGIARVYARTTSSLAGEIEDSLEVLIERQ